MPPEPFDPVPIDDPERLAALSEVVRAWEPSLDLVRPATDALLYEPDGTLYAVCLADVMAAEANRHPRSARRGDLLVVPREFAVEAGPVVDLLALRHDGPPPDHFRERFLQVWGFEWLAAPDPPSSSTGLTEVIAASDFRFRVPYAIVDVARAEQLALGTSDDLRLLVLLEGDVSAALGEMEFVVPAPIPARHLLAVPPGTVCWVEGEGRVGVLTVLNELAHNARRPGPGRDHGPEYRPRAPA